MSKLKDLLKLLSLLYALARVDKDERIDTKEFYDEVVDLEKKIKADSQHTISESLLCPLSR